MKFTRIEAGIYKATKNNTTYTIENTGERLGTGRTVWDITIERNGVKSFINTDENDNHIDTFKKAKEVAFLNANNACWEEYLNKVRV